MVYVQKDFIDKFIRNKKFLQLYRNYKKSDYDRDLAPSPDRIDSDSGYTIGNIKFVTFRENYLSSVAWSKNKKGAYI